MSHSVKRELAANAVIEDHRLPRARAFGRFSSCDSWVGCSVGLFIATSHSAHVGCVMRFLPCEGDFDTVFTTDPSRDGRQDDLAEGTSK